MTAAEVRRCDPDYLVTFSQREQHQLRDQTARNSTMNALMETSQSTFSFLISAFCRQNCTFFKWLRFPVVFEESTILPAEGRNQKCWLWDVQETRCLDIYITGHGKASPFQPWCSVRCAIPTFYVNQCSLRGSTYCFCLLRLGLAVTGAPAEHFGTRIYGVAMRRRDWWASPQSGW